LLNKGNELFEGKDYNNAMIFYENSIYIDQKNNAIFILKGNELFDLKDHNNAELYFEKAIKIDRNN